MANTITTPWRVMDMIPITPTSTYLSVIEGGVGTGESWMSSMMSSWISPIVKKAIGQAKRFPMAILGVRTV
jgi:hypothetical protein